MAHFAKYTAQNYKGLIGHLRRTNETELPHIDKEKSKLNNRWVPDRRFQKDNEGKKVFNKGLSDWDDFKNYMASLEHSNRKDLKCVVDCVITIPEELKNAPYEKQQEFFSKADQFMSQKFGFKNLLMAQVHYDEKTPHLHYCFVPAEEYEKDGVTHKKVCCKEVITRSMLQKFHGELQEYMDKELGYHVSIENGKTQNGNKSINQLKAESAKAENIKLKRANSYLMSRMQSYVACEIKDPEFGSRWRNLYHECGEDIKKQAMEKVQNDLAGELRRLALGDKTKTRTKTLTLGLSR